MKFLFICLVTIAATSAKAQDVCGHVTSFKLVEGGIATIKVQFATGESTSMYYETAVISALTTALAHNLEVCLNPNDPRFIVSISK